VAGEFSLFDWAQVVSFIVEFTVLCQLPSMLLRTICLFGMGFMSEMYRRACKTRLDVYHLFHGAISRMLTAQVTYRVLTMQGSALGEKRVPHALLDSLGGERDAGLTNDIMMQHLNSVFAESIADGTMDEAHLERLGRIFFHRLDEEDNHSVTRAEFMNVWMNGDCIHPEEVCRFFANEKKAVMLQRFLGVNQRQSRASFRQLQATSQGQAPEALRQRLEEVSTDPPAPDLPEQGQRSPRRHHNGESAHMPEEIQNHTADEGRQPQHQQHQQRQQQQEQQQQQQQELVREWEEEQAKLREHMHDTEREQQTHQLAAKGRVRFASQVQSDVEFTPRQQSLGQTYASSRLHSAECNPQGAGSASGSTSSPRGVSGQPRSGNNFQVPAASPRVNASPRMFRMFGSSGVHNIEISELTSRVTFVEEYQVEMMHRIEQLETCQSKFQHASSSKVDPQISKAPCKADRLQQLDAHVHQLGTTVAHLQDDLSLEALRLRLECDSRSVSSRAEFVTEIRDTSFLCHQMSEISRNLEQRYMRLEERLLPSFATGAQIHRSSIARHPGDDEEEQIRLPNHVGSSKTRSVSSLASDDSDALISEALASDGLAEADVDVIDLDGTRHATFSMQGRARSPLISARRRALRSSESTSSMASDASSHCRKSSHLPEMEQEPTACKEVLPPDRWRPRNSSWARGDPSWARGDPPTLAIEHPFEPESSKWAHDVSSVSSSLEPKEHQHARIRPPWANSKQDGCGAGPVSGDPPVTPCTISRQSMTSIKRGLG